MRSWNLYFVAVVIGLMMSSPARAQGQSTRQVTMSVKDYSGAGIPNTQIYIASKDKAMGLIALTDANGSAVIELLPGSYTFSEFGSGFRRVSGIIDVPANGEPVPVRTVLQIGTGGGVEVLPIYQTADAPMPQPEGTVQIGSFSIKTNGDMQRLLFEVGENYRNAKSLHIQKTQVRTAKGTNINDWERVTFSVAQAPGGRMRLEFRGPQVLYREISDGKTKWSIRTLSKEYMRQALGSTQLQRTADQIGWLRWLKNIDGNLGAGRIVGSEIVENGYGICSCIKIIGPPGAKTEQSVETAYFIDPVQKILVREVRTEHLNVQEDDTATEVVTNYATALDTNIPDSFFTYVPAKEMKLVEQFDEQEKTNPVGRPAPAIGLKTLEGKLIDLKAFRGKPVVLDFWATWCGSCIASMTDVDRLHKDLKNKGVVLLGVNQDSEPEAAVRFLKNKNYSWFNVSDPDQKLSQSWGVAGIPTFVIVDKEGNVAFVLNGYDPGDDVKIRYELHRMDPSIPLAEK